MFVSGKCLIDVASFRGVCLYKPVLQTRRRRGGGANVKSANVFQGLTS